MRILNKRWCFFVFLFSILILFGIYGWTKAEYWISLPVIMISLALLIGYALIMPRCGRFDDEGITVYYTFGIKTHAKWEELHHVEDHHSGYTVFPWFRSYHIGYFKSKLPFITEASIPKNKKTTAQIEKNYMKNIEKYG